MTMMNSSSYILLLLTSEIQPHNIIQFKSNSPKATIKLNNEFTPESIIHIKVILWK